MAHELSLWFGAKLWHCFQAGKMWLVGRLQMIGKYERGRAIPSVDAAKKIADAFDVSLDYLVGDGVTASFDKKAVHRLQEIQAMDSKEKESFFGIIDAVIRDYKVRKAYV